MGEYEWPNGPVKPLSGQGLETLQQQAEATSNIGTYPG